MIIALERERRELPATTHVSLISAGHLVLGGSLAKGANDTGDHLLSVVAVIHVGFVLSISDDTDLEQYGGHRAVSQYGQTVIFINTQPCIQQRTAFPARRTGVL